MKILKVVAILVYRITYILIAQRITNGRIFCYCFKTICLSCKKTGKSENIVKNLLSWGFFNNFQKLPATNFGTKLFLRKNLNPTLDHNIETIDLSFGMNTFVWSKDAFLQPFCHLDLDFLRPMTDEKYARLNYFKLMRLFYF